ncbi:MAG: carboxymuconolactone decarboxylase family protein [Bdellovibrionales bacterium]|nr:carboxymuconolactone decarboxylase family protein [Bdellovibrionales bacterium]
MNYYESDDLKKFQDVGKFAPDLMAKFFDYYNSVVATDSALSKREKSLIGLALAHALKCPYCIDAYTSTCLQNGADPEQMTEAVHMAAAMQAGITMVHGVQMQNQLINNGVLSKQ